MASVTSMDRGIPPRERRLAASGEGRSVNGSSLPRLPRPRQHTREIGRPPPRQSSANVCATPTSGPAGISGVLIGGTNGQRTPSVGEVGPVGGGGGIEPATIHWRKERRRAIIAFSRRESVAKFRFRAPWSPLQYPGVLPGPGDGLETASTRVASLRTARFRMISRLRALVLPQPSHRNSCAPRDSRYRFLAFSG